MATKTTRCWGEDFTVEANMIRRGTMAIMNETGEERQISFNGYIGNDLTIRKAIAVAWQFPGFSREVKK